MTTKMKRQGATELPRFAVGALAIAGAYAANGATVQITFNNSYISSTAGNNLVADFGNDGTAEIGGRTMNVLGGIAVFVNPFGDSASLGAAYWIPQGSGYLAAAAVDRDIVSSGGGAGVNATKLGLVAISFTDTSIRSGAQTTGYLDLTATATAGGEIRITVNRLIFDDATGGTIGGLSVNDAAFTEYTLSAVPEPGSNLALLALGAGGLTLRRRLKRAA